MKLQFLGGTGTVTGSKYLVKQLGKNYLIDCGLFQGLKALRLKNREPLSIDPKDITSIFLTHAHLDHSGYLPLIRRNGFRGKVYATKPTHALCKILLLDSAKIQEEDADLANRHGFSKHHPALPLYTTLDAEMVLEQFHPVSYGERYAFMEDTKVSWHRAGHILGASFVELDMPWGKLVFSGDMGRMNDPILRSPSIIQQADYLVLESTYGNRVHPNEDPKIKFAEIINETIKKGGSIIIPAFAVGRAQSILHYIYEMKETHMIPGDLPVFLDSPMASKVTHLLCDFLGEHNLSLKMCTKATAVAQHVKTVEESKKIDHIAFPKIIVSASGMLTGGRVLHHLKVYGPKSNNTILLTGYQAEGTRGADLLNGKKTIKIHGEYVEINARVDSLDNLSAHADSNEIVSWLKNFQKAPKQIFITHGEKEASLALKNKITSELGFNCYIPTLGEEVEL